MVKKQLEISQGQPVAAKEYKAKKNIPVGVSGYGKVKNARQYAKAMMKMK